MRGSDEKLIDEQIYVWQQYYSKVIDCEFFEGATSFFQNESLSMKARVNAQKIYFIKMSFVADDIKDILPEFLTGF